MIGPRCRKVALVALVAQLAAVTGLASAPLPALAATTACATPGADGSPASITGVVNTYFPGTASSLGAGTKSIALGTANTGGATTPVAIGDLLLIVQMQGATINSTNTSAYGSGGTSGAGDTGDTAGQYEYVTATSAGSSGATITISGAGAGGGLVHTYTRAAATGTQGQQTYQIIRVPQYATTTLTSGVTAAPWGYPAGGSVLDSTGGVLAIETTGALNLGGAAIAMSGFGFRGGGVIAARGGTGGTGTDYVGVSTAGFHGTKGEGIAGSPIKMYTGSALITTGVEGYPNGAMARGAPGNAGGGGTDSDPSANDQNSGGGGGGNGGAGGVGGNAWSSGAAVGGRGGAAYTPSLTAVVLGGGGGAGNNNDGTNAPYGSSGGSGGGLVFIRAGSLAGTGSISVNGTNGVAPINDGGGGGGAGGSVVVLTNSGTATGLSVTANGGNGSDANDANKDPHGPGGGGGGGVIVSSGALSGASVNPGANGTTPNAGGTPIAYGAAPGSTGTTLTTASIANSPGSSADVLCSVALVPTKSVSATAINRNATLTYSIVAKNNGPGEGDGTVFADAVPAGLTITGATCGSPTTNATTGKTAACNAAAPTVAGQNVTSTITTLPPGTSVTFTITATAATGATYSNTATMTPPAYYGIAASTSNTVQTLVNPKVSVTKTASATPVNQGTAISYSIVVTNVGVTGGSVSADGTIVGDTVPSNFTAVSVTCGSPTGGAVCPTGAITVTANAFSSTVPTLPSGATVTYTVNATATTIGATTNTANLTAPTGRAFDPASTTSASAPVQINTSALVSKTVQNITQGTAAGTSNQGKPGDVLQYVLSFTNSTGVPLSGFAFNDSVPTSTTFVSAQCITASPPCSVTTQPTVGGTGAVVWSFSSPLAVNATYSVSFRVKIN